MIYALTTVVPEMHILCAQAATHRIFTSFCILAVRNNTQYSPPMHTEPVAEQGVPFQGSHTNQPLRGGLPEYPRENPLYDEEDEDEVQQVCLHTMSL